MNNNKVRMQRNTFVVVFDIGAARYMKVAKLVEPSTCFV